MRTPQPQGEPVPDGVTVAGRPTEALVGATTSLRRPKPVTDAAVLFARTHGSPTAESTWTYMAAGSQHVDGFRAASLCGRRDSRGRRR